jgi:galactokinase
VATVPTSFTARAPGRVNLIGDHTDYTGGLVLPMTIDRWTVIRGTRGRAGRAGRAGRVALVSADEPEPLRLELPVANPAAVEPRWGRYVAGVAAEMPAPMALQGRVTTDIPVGAGLSSSAALELVAALALGFDGTPTELALLGQRAEQRASGVPCGIMDQLCIAAGVADHALLIDCHSLSVQPVSLPDGVDVVVRFVAHRTLAGSEYGERVEQCATAEREVGPLRLATLDSIATISDALIRRRARHVVTENGRVGEFAAALAAADLTHAGELMVASHASLRDDYETSTAAMDGAVEELIAMPGVYGARMTGGGFGGCVVALAEPGAVTDGWAVRAVDGASIVIEMES